MDILFIYSGLTVEERYGTKGFGKIGGYLPPLGIAYLASFLRKHGFTVDIMDAQFGMPEKEILNYIRQTDARAVGFSSLTSAFLKTTSLARLVRENFPDKLIILGGHHATIAGEDILARENCYDLVVYGEGEETLLDIMNEFKAGNFERDKFLKSDRSLSRIKGIVFKKEGQVIQNSRSELISNLDGLPYPARDLLPMTRYVPLPNQYRRLPVVHMVAIRGCPYSCTFCSNNAVFGRKIRSRSPRGVIDEIRQVKKDYGTREISFWDDTMTIQESWVEELCDRLIKDKLDITWTCYSRADAVEKDLLKKMKKAGCFNIFYGFESGSQRLLDRIEKGINLAQIERANRLTKEAGIEVRASFMLGLPEETPALARETLKFAISLEPDYVQFSLTTPYPGTKLYQEAERYGRLIKDFWKYHGWAPVFIPYGYKGEQELLNIEREITRRFYWRWRYIFNRFKKIRTFEDIRRYLRGLQMLWGFTRRTELNCQ